MRLNPDGSLDPAFGAGGVVRVPFCLKAAWANGSAVVEDRQPEMALALLSRGGAVQRRVRTSPGPFGGYAKAVRATRGGILVAGRAYAEPGTGPSDWALARYTATGKPLGVTTTDFGTGEDAAEAIALTPGRATLAGSIYSSHGVARYFTR